MSGPIMAQQSEKRLKSCAGLKTIAEAAQGLDRLFPRAMRELAPQQAERRIQGVVGHLAIQTPKLLMDRFAGHRIAGPAHQEFQKLEFALRELHGAARCVG